MVDARLDRADRELSLVKAAVLENSREIREVRGDIREVRGDVHELRGSVTRIELAMDKKVDRDEVEAIVARAITR